MGDTFFAGYLGSMDSRAELVRTMRDNGMTLQQIADELGYKSRTSVMNILKR